LAAATICLVACGAGYWAQPVATTRSATTATTILQGLGIRDPVNTGDNSNILRRAFMGQSGPKRHGFMAGNLKEILSQRHKYA
jgi:hypothetical protein